MPKTSRQKPPARPSRRLAAKAKPSAKKTKPKANYVIGQAGEAAPPEGERRRGGAVVLTLEKKQEIVKLMADGLPLYKACEHVGVSRITVFHARQKDQEWHSALEEAWRFGIHRLEAEAQRRAIEGVDKPVVYQGEITDSYKEYSDTLLIFLMKGRDPAKFRDNVNLTNSDGSIGAAFAAAVRKVAEETK